MLAALLAWAIPVHAAPALDSDDASLISSSADEQLRPLHIVVDPVIAPQDPVVLPKEGATAMPLSEPVKPLTVSDTAAWEPEKLGQPPADAPHSSFAAVPEPSTTLLLLVAALLAFLWRRR